MKQDVLLLGASGFPNYGDDRIAITWTKFYRRLRTRRVFIETISPSFCAAALAFAGVEALPINFIWSAMAGAGLTSIPLAVEAGTRLFEQSRPLASWASDLFEAVGTVHLHGGGYINSQWPHSAFLVGAAVAFKRRRGSRVIATGLGLQPLSADEAAALSTAFAEFDLVEFRDRPSFDAIKRDGPGRNLRLGFDDFFLNPADTQAERLSRPRLHVCIQANFSHDELNDLARTIAEHVGASEYSQVRYLEFCPQEGNGGDQTFFSRLVEALGHRPRLERVPYRSLLQNGAEAAEGDCGIVTRFHAHLLLARMGVRGYFIEPPGLRDYYGYKHQSLVEAGSGWRRLDPSAPINFRVLAASKLPHEAVGEKTAVARFGLPAF